MSRTNQRRVYEHTDETGASLGFYAKLSEVDKAIRDWIDMGAETQFVTHTYTNTRAGVVALLNSIRQQEP